MIFYLAARFSRNREMWEFAQRLRALGHDVCSTWIDGTIRPDDECAGRDYMDLLQAGGVISFTEYPKAPGRARGGRHVEFGIGLARGLRMILIGPRENVFHFLPDVEQFDTAGACIEALRMEAHRATMRDAVEAGA